jgi:hypothetical protein
LAAKVTNNKSVGSCTTAFDDKSRQRTTTQQQTKNWSSKGRWWLVMRPSEGSGQQLALKVVATRSLTVA